LLHIEDRVAMNVSPGRRGLTVAVLIGILISTPVHGQVAAPIGADDSTTGPGSGLSVSPTGSFHTSVPIDLPSPRRGLPVPFSIEYQGSGHAGAAGIGWDVPTWYVRRSNTTWSRKPAAQSNPFGQDVVAERVYLSMGGASQVMVPGAEPGLYLPFVADEYMELRESPAGWTLHTAAGIQYGFTRATQLSNGVIDDDNLWLLTEIRDRVGTDRVTVRYETVDVGACGRDFAVAGFAYGYDRSNTPLYEVELRHSLWWLPHNAGSFPLCLGNGGEVAVAFGSRELFEGGGYAAGRPGLLSRTRVLEKVIVKARNNLAPAASPRAIRTYHLAYQPDLDTLAPRLATVDVTGEGTTTMLPVARYHYGSATHWKGDTRLPDCATTETVVVPSTWRFQIYDEVYLGGASSFVTVHAGTYRRGTLIEAVQAQLFPDWTFGIDAGGHAWFARPGTIISVAWLDLGLRDLLGFSADAEDWDSDAAGPYAGAAPVAYATSEPGCRLEVHYSAPREVPRDPGALAYASSFARSEVEIEYPNVLQWEKRVENVRSRYAIRDFTGDGVPDLLFRGSDGWHLRAGVVTDAGVSLSSGPSMSWTPATGPPEIHHTRNIQYLDTEERWRRKRMVTTEIVRMFVDWNGDGRLDVLDAKSGDLGRWNLWLNTPGPEGLPHWRLVSVDVSGLRQHIESAGLGHGLYWDDGLTPLERSRSWPFYASDVECKEWRADDTSVQRSCQYTNVPPGAERVRTYGEWAITDLNGDGFPDLVANSVPVLHQECEARAQLEPWFETTPQGDVIEWHGEWRQNVQSIRLGYVEEVAGWTCDPAGQRTEPVANRAVVFLNREGANTHELVPRDYGPTELNVGYDGVSQWTNYGNDEYWTGLSHPGATFSDHRGVGRMSYEHDGSRYRSTRDEVCRVGASSAQAWTSWQSTGYADINGDGIPDQVFRGTQDWFVRFGTTVGFGPPRRLGANLPFALSETDGTCGGTSHSVAGLVDLDGDAVPEIARVVDGVLMAASLANQLEAGRLIAIENGYGARTEIRYANNKAERHTSHQVPAPEVVVAETQTFFATARSPRPSATPTAPPTCTSIRSGVARASSATASTSPSSRRPPGRCWPATRRSWNGARRRRPARATPGSRSMAGSSGRRGSRACSCPIRGRSSSSTSTRRTSAASESRSTGWSSCRSGRTRPAWSWSASA
jgi:hypothetical protein